MWSFWLISLGIGWHNIDIELIIDIIVILLIVGITIYITRRKNKANGWNGVKYIDGKIWIDEQKWFVVKTNVKENIKKYIEIKRSFKSLLSIIFMPWFIIASIICIIMVWISIYEIITNQTNSETIPSLVIFLILLWFCIFYLIKTKISSDKIHKNILFKIIILFPSMFISLLIVGLWRFGSRYMCDKFKLWAGLSSLIQLFCGFLSMILWLLFTIYVVGYLFSPKNPSKKDSNKKMIDDEHVSNAPTNNEQFDNTPTNNEQLDNEPLNDTPTYDELIDNNKKLEEETWFHQWPLLQ